MCNQVRTFGARLVCWLTLVVAAQAGQETAPTAATGIERSSALAQQLVAAHSLAAVGPKKADPVTEVGAYLSLRMPGLALAAFKNAHSRMAPATAAVFEAQITTLQAAQTSTAVEILAACLEAEASHDLFGSSLSELQRRCGGRVWTNANEGELSVYFTNLLPVCEVRIPLRSLTEAQSGNGFREIAQPLQLVTELAQLPFVLPVVNLTDSTAARQVEVRCLGPERKPGGSTYTMRAGASHVFTVTPARALQSEASGQAALEKSVLAMCIDAAKFAFPSENVPRK